MEKTNLPLLHHRMLAAGAKPALRYTGGDFEAHRARCTEKLSELLGMDTFTRCEPDLTVTEDVTENGCRRIHFTVETEPGYLAHADLLLPEDQSGPLPLCCCLQGHSKGAHISLGIAKFPGDEETIKGGDRDFAVRAVAEGYAALAIEQRAFGVCGGTENGPACAEPARTAVLLGRTLIGERVWDVSRVLDAVQAAYGAYVTMENSVLMGNSGGGTATWYTAALEHRFAAFMPSCAVCTYRDSIVAMEHCPCNYVPGIMKWFDMGDMAAMIAPNKLVIVCGKDDPIFPLAGVRETWETVQQLYAAAGTPDACALVIGEGSHRFYADDAWPVLKKLLAQ
ncbi:MAG: hypothetical protein IJ412_07600 [Oscillospiraceae bacterium]|nr:hypothetical protein [Oscillospiraceae bacterium]